MIERIDIGKFGQFESFSWDKVIGRGTTCKRLNIIYGRNYSGKTTLSRIFRCIEKKELHPNYCKDAQFNLHLKDTAINNTQISAEISNLNVRVYNSDFIHENLSWLHNPDGTIQPFTILGETNVEIEEKIRLINEHLGDSETNGLLVDLINKGAEWTKALNHKRQQENELTLKIKDKAREIKTNTALYNNVNYAAPSLEKDIEAAKAISNISESDIEEFIKLLKEETKPKLNRFSESKKNLTIYISKTNELISKKVKSSRPIKDLIEDKELQEWVRAGISNHKGKREICAFCTNPLPKDLFELLEEHFSKESEKLREEIDALIVTVNNAKSNISEYLKLSKNQLYNSLHGKFDTIIQKWEEAKSKYWLTTDQLVHSLEQRKDNIFIAQDVREFSDESDLIATIFNQFNLLIDENNLKASTLDEDKDEARRTLRLLEVRKFLKDIDYDERVKKKDASENEVYQLNNQKEKIKNDINVLLEQKRKLEAAAKDESIGAELVNNHLTNFFGHDELKLVAVGDKPNIKFEITRANNKAKNLSEGECSLISFCYFIAKIEDQMADSSNLDSLIIYIDDPISSLDSNHIFFTYSLIDKVIAKPRKYGQLFISTHNLDFLKYLKRLTAFDGKDSIAHFLIERRQQQNNKRSYILDMPGYIRDYVTEFNYLFNEIYNVYEETKGSKKMRIENTYNTFYNLPNNMRKFLECYLFYKFPNNESPLDNLPKLFDGTVPVLINRIVNEYSHLTFIDRGWQPIDVDEAEACATLIIEKIKEIDKPQFDALCESIGVKIN